MLGRWPGLFRKEPGHAGQAYLVQQPGVPGLPQQGWRPRTLNQTLPAAWEITRYQGRPEPNRLAIKGLRRNILGTSLTARNRQRKNKPRGQRWRFITHSLSTGSVTFSGTLAHRCILTHTTPHPKKTPSPNRCGAGHTPGWCTGRRPGTTAG